MERRKNKGAVTLKEQRRKSDRRGEERRVTIEESYDPKSGLGFSDYLDRGYKICTNRRTNPDRRKP